MISDTGALATHCQCGRSYTLHQFRRLGKPYWQEIGDGDPLIEARQCQCGSHISIYVDHERRLCKPPEWARGAA